MNKIRRCIVDGMFYPENKRELSKSINKYLKVKENFHDADRIIGIIAPHAGYYYSGQCAGYAYKAIKSKNYKTAIIIAPSHKFNHFSFSVGTYESYETPLGNYPVNEDIAEKILENPNFVFYPEVHNVEHSIEVQIPFLQIVKPDCDFVPILIGEQSLENSKILADEIYNLIKDKPKDFLIICSSDLSHYHPAEDAYALDKLLMRYIGKLNIDLMIMDYSHHKVEACGIGGILTMMLLAEKMDLKVEHLKYMTSGDVSGETSQVVGYLASVIY